MKLLSESQGLQACFVILVIRKAKVYDPGRLMSESDSQPARGGLKSDSGSDSVPSWIQNYKVRCVCCTRFFPGSLWQQGLNILSLQPADRGIGLPIDVSSDSDVEQVTQPTQLPTQGRLPVSRSFSEKRSSGTRHTTLSK